MEAREIHAAEAALALHAPELAVVRARLIADCTALGRPSEALFLPDGGVPMLRIRTAFGPAAAGGITFWIREDESGDWALLADPDPEALRPTLFATRLARRLGRGEAGLLAASRLIIAAVSLLPPDPPDDPGA
jgi:hypothetical protein